MAEYERNEENGSIELFSRAVKAGKRTYFFDVKSTKRNDYYLTITESKKRFENSGRYHFEKHKLFLYKEDFEKFASGLQEAVNFISEMNANNPNLSSHDFNDENFNDSEDQ